MQSVQPFRRARSGRLLAAGALVAFCGCARAYVPRTPHEATATEAGVRITDLVTVPVEGSLPPGGVVVVTGLYRAEKGAAMTVPRLAPANSTPCEAGVAANVTLIDGSGEPEENDAVPARTGKLAIAFRRDALDRASLLRQPTALDIRVLDETGAGGRTCLRVPIVEGRAEAEWTDQRPLSIGIGWTTFVPGRRIYDVSLASMFAVRAGPWIGPVRLRGQLALGGAAARGTNPNLVAVAYGTGLLADALIFDTGRFGLGVAAGYDLTGITFTVNHDEESHAGSGFKGAIHGPRAGVSFAWLPQPSPGAAFEVRPDTASATLELFGAAAFNTERSAVPAVWITLSVDAAP